MKYLGVIDSFGTGGAERSNADIWSYLKESGVSIRLIALRQRKEGTQDEVLRSGYKVKILPDENLYNNVKFIAKTIREWQPDVVHSTLFKSNIRVRYAKLLAPKFIHVESLVNTTYTKARLADPAVNYFNLSAYWLLDFITAHLFVDRFHAITETVKNHYRRRLLISTSKISVIPRGRQPNRYVSDPTNRERYFSEFNIPVGSKLIVSTGRQEYQKAHTTALEAVGRLKNDLKYLNFRYLMLGREGTASKDILRTIKKNDLQEHVIQTGHRYDVERILAAADLFVFPSRYEGLGVSMIEAQAAGLPIICSDIEVLREVTDPHSAIYVETEDAVRFANEILHLLSNEEMRLRMKRSSIRHFDKHYRLDEVHEQMLYFFQSVAN